MALFDFESESGKFPDSSAVSAARRDTGTTHTPPDHPSNDPFAQLIASGIAGSECLSSAKAKSMPGPDDVFTADATILDHGECSFATIWNDKQKSSVAIFL